jgi:hypothetical protein
MTMSSMKIILTIHYSDEKTNFRKIKLILDLEN